MLSGFGGGMPSNLPNINSMSQGNMLAGISQYLQPWFNQQQQGQNNPLMPLPPSGGSSSPFPNTNFTGQGNPAGAPAAPPGGNNMFTPLGPPGTDWASSHGIQAYPMGPGPGGAAASAPNNGIPMGGHAPFMGGPGGGGATLPGAFPQQLGALLAQGG